VRSLAWTLLGLALAGEAPAAAEEPAVIAVLPFISAEKALEIYGVPVSRVLAGELRGAAGAPVHIVADPAALPRRIEWVIDGRIVDRGGKVVLEARLRDPDQGSAAGQVETRARPLRQIDRLARDLARQLVPLLARARLERDREAAAKATAPTPTVVDAAPRPVRANKVALLLVGRAGGHLMQLGLAPDPAVTTRAADLVHRIGRRPQVVELRGIASPGAVKAALAGSGASYALLSEVRDVQFSWLGVLTARGRVRLVLVDTRGSALYDSIVETDTVVGSRGDRHEALLGFVARQALDIAAPRLKRILAR
jgi:hypothetical protein